MGADDCFTIIEKKRIDFFLEKFGECEKKYIIKVKTVVNETYQNPEILIDDFKFCNEQDLLYLILIINTIYHNFIIDKNDMKNLKERIENIIPKKYKEEKNVNLGALDDIRKNKFNYKNIKNCFNIFKFIYEKKEEIGADDINYLLREIKFLLEKNKILDDLYINVLYDFLGTIFGKEASQNKKKNDDSRKNGGNNQNKNISETSNNIIQNTNTIQLMNNPNNLNNQTEKENGNSNNGEINGSSGNNEIGSLDLEKIPLVKSHYIINN